VEALIRLNHFNTMVLIAAFAAVGIASPALAQSFDPEAGSGNVAGFSYASTLAQTENLSFSGAAMPKLPRVRTRCMPFASVWGASSNSSSNDPAFHVRWQRRLQSNAPAILKPRKEGASLGSTFFVARSLFLPESA
jgi:hypothetical protein